ncbi:YdbH domain-containing protein [Thiohalomonas denitrificans]|uniref:YdbH domain-containing protein n=1 Tax=Thiohalomonas denitrificans TaxID=415747 RepID=UPI0026EB8FA9|nr:YdbH domain-containing protein [Thiohalomonas denitrificans]
MQKSNQGIVLTRLARILGRLLPALVVLAVLLYLSLPVATGWLAQHLLKNHGLAHPHVKVTHVGPDRLRIESLRFTWNGVPVSLGPMEVTYGLAGVLEGRVESIYLERGNIAVPSHEGAAGVGQFPSRLPRLPLLPFETLDIEALTIEVPEKPAATLAGNWIYSADHLNGRMVLAGGGAERAIVTTEWREEILELKLFVPPEFSNPQVRLRLSRAVVGLKAEAALEGSAASLRNALAPWWNMPEQWQGRGRTLLDGVVRENGFEGEYRLDASLQGLTAWQAELDGNVQLDSERLVLTVSDGGRVDGRGPGSQRLGIAFHDSFRAESRFRNVGSPVFAGRGEIVVTADSITERLDATARLTDPRVDLGEVPEIRTLVQAAGTARRDGKPPIRLAAGGPLHWTPDALQWRVQPDASIAISKPYAGPSESPLELSLLNEAEIAWKRKGGWTVSPARWRVDAPDWGIETAQTAVDGMYLEVQEVSGAGEHWEASGTFSVRSLQGRVGAGELPPMSAKGRFTAGPEQVVISAAATGPVLSARISVTHHLEAQTGAARWQLEPVLLRPEGLSLASFYQPWPYPFDVGKGTIHAGGQFQWQTGESTSLSGEFDLKGEKLGGYYKELLFSGAELDAWLALEPDGILQTRQPAPLTIERMTAGFPGRNFQTRAALRIGPQLPLQLRLEHPSVELLGGRVRSDIIELDLAQPVNRFAVELERIALDQLLDLEHAPIEGFGRVSGMLPLQLSEQGLAMQGGQVAAIESGVIRYRPGEEGQALEKSGQNMQLAIAALRDFHYESLKADADYSPSGQLELEIRLLGNNPDLFQGRSVQFNINLEENIPDLLRSLRAGQELEGQIDQWVQDFYRRRQNRKQ